MKNNKEFDQFKVRFDGQSIGIDDQGRQHGTFISKRIDGHNNYEANYVHGERQGLFRGWNDGIISYAWYFHGGDTEGECVLFYYDKIKGLDVNTI
jgi:hypothetical protein